MSLLLRFIRAATPGAGTDQDLLDCFVRHRDEVAFAQIVERYGALVWSTCRRLAEQDAEDAFQAVFLILARKAGSIRGPLPAWLHGVARRIAANLRRDTRRRVAVEKQAARSSVTRPDDVSLREGLSVLDDELARLPEPHRAVLIACCLEGHSRDEAAAQLGWTEGQVKGRLERAREMLRVRLGRRGIDLGAMLLAATVSRTASAVPVLSTAAILTAEHAVSLSALSLTNGVLHAMQIQKIKIVAALLLMTACAGTLTYRSAMVRTATAEDVQPGEKPITAAPVPPNRWEKLLQDKDLTAMQRSAYEQIAKLRSVKIEEEDWGTIAVPSRDKNSKLPTDVLFGMGLDALPMLAEALDDETPTATVTVFREGSFREKKVWKVNEIVALLIVRIADRNFVIGELGKELEIRDIARQPTAAAKFRKMVVDWHGKFASKTPTERKIADVSDAWFRNRFDAVIWLGGTRSKDGRTPIRVRVDEFYADKNREYSSLTRAEMSHCSEALGQIGDKADLPQVRKVCKDMSYWLETYGISGSAMLENLFRSYQGLMLLGEKDEAIKELERLFAAHGAKFEESAKKEYAERLKAAKGGAPPAPPPPPAVDQRDPEDVFRKACERLVALEAKHDLLKGVSEVKPLVERDEKGQLKSSRLVFERNAVPPGKGDATAKDESKPFIYVSIQMWSGRSQQPPGDLHVFEYKGVTYQMVVPVFGSDAELVKAIRKAVIEPLSAPVNVKPELTLLRTDPPQLKIQHLVIQGSGGGSIHRVGPEHFKLTRVADGQEVALVVAYDRERLEIRREGKEVARPPTKDTLPYNALFKGVRFQLDNGEYDAKDFAREQGYLELFGRAKLEPGVRYRLTWACWPVGALKASEITCEFESGK